MRNIFILFVVIALGLMFFPLIENFKGNDKLSDLASFYAQKENVEKVNSANLVTAVVVTYRGFDTLGEVTILFLTAAIIAFFLKPETIVQRELKANSEIFKTASKLIIPMMILLGVYIFMNGHLSPGGGFQGGAVIASAMIVMLLAFPASPLNAKVFGWLESASGLVFVGLAALGAIAGAGFLDNTILPMGEFGQLFSAGAIPVIYSFVGLKVGAELSNILNEYKAVQSEK